MVVLFILYIGGGGGIVDDVVLLLFFLFFDTSVSNCKHDTFINSVYAYLDFMF